MCLFKGDNSNSILSIGISPTPEWLSDRSGMNREIHVPLRESPMVRFPWATRPDISQQMVHLADIIYRAPEAYHEA